MMFTLPGGTRSERGWTPSRGRFVRKTGKIKVHCAKDKFKVVRLPLG